MDDYWIDRKSITNLAMQGEGLLVCVIQGDKSQGETRRH
jgi:hypothetical protein